MLKDEPTRAIIKQQLEGFQRVSLKPGEAKKITFTLSLRQLSEVDAQGIRTVQPGSYSIAVGGAQPKDARATTTAQTAAFTIDGTQELPH